MQGKRVISGVILIPIVITLLVLGGWAYRLLVLLVSLIAAAEFARMFRKKGLSISLLWVSLTALAWEIESLLPGDKRLLPVVTVVMLGLTLRELWLTRKLPSEKNPTERWSLTLAGGTYIGIGGAHLLGLRAMPNGLWWVLTTLFVVWISDSVAYYAGSRWGRHKMAPTISPGKSWEGYGAQVISGPLVGLAFAWLWPTVFPAAVDSELLLTLWRGGLLGIIVSTLCPAGDFLISMMKREVGVKDTSNLIPGHGGMLDRIDSVLWAGMLAHLLAQMLI